MKLANKPTSAALLQLVLLSAVVRGQDFEYLNPPEELWRASTAATVEGNGLFWAPDGSALVGTFSDGSVRAFNPATGEVAGSYTPSASSGSVVSGLGGVTFAGYGPNATGSPYLVYAVADNAADPTTAQTRVICLSPAGELLFESVPLDGVPAGTPQTTYDGQYIMITHNIEQTTGIFTVLDVTGASSGSIPVAYQYENSTNPFSPIGVYHQPALGYYDGGENNTNDIFIWAFDTAAGSTMVGTGAMFGFQMPMDSSGNYTVAMLGDRDFQASTAPVLTNSGVSMYWAVTRAEQYCWVGNPAVKRTFFNRGRTNKVSLDRGDPAYISSRATPSLSFAVNSTDDQVVFGPGASNEIFRLNSNYTEVLVTNTSNIVSSRVAVSPDNQVIYYATQDSIVAQLNAETLELNWQFNTLAGVYADITLNSAGTVLYVVDNSGVVMAMQVASSSAPTPSPTVPGTSDFPSAVPTGGPDDSSPVPTVEGGGGGGGPAEPTAGGGGAPTPSGGGGGGPTPNNPTGTSAASRLFGSSSSAWVAAATAVAAISGCTLLTV